MTEYIDTKKAAEILDVGQGWIAALCRTSALRASKRGGKWTIERRSVDALAAEREQPPSAEDLESVAEEIANDEEAKELAKKKAGDSFRDRVLRIASRYGPGVTLIVAGAAGVCAGDIAVSPALIAKGIETTINRLFRGGTTQVN